MRHTDKTAQSTQVKFVGRDNYESHGAHSPIILTKETPEIKETFLGWLVKSIFSNLILAIIAGVTVIFLVYLISQKLGIVLN